MDKLKLENIAEWPDTISHEQLNDLGFTDGLIHVWRTRLIAICGNPDMKPKFRNYYTAPIKEHLMKKKKLKNP